jgi:hypothetical protein
MPSATATCPISVLWRPRTLNNNPKALIHMSEREVLFTAYRDFNARNIEAVISRMHRDVEWANGMEGGHVHGKDAVRDYWTHQFKTLNPHVDPVSIDPGENGAFVVTVHQVVHDMEGNLLLDTTVYHTYQFRDGLIARMDIDQNSPFSGKNA